MKKIILYLIGCLLIKIAKAQPIYTKAYGDSTNPAIIYIHGGPGYNAVSFEITTAKELSEKGFNVICYDRRGEGRSINSDARFFSPF